jgi:hypothetical protein
MKTQLDTEFTIEKNPLGLTRSASILRIKSKRLQCFLPNIAERGEGFVLTPEECVELGTMLIRAAGPKED